MRRWQTTRGGASEIGPWSCPMLARRGLRDGGWGNAWPTEVAEGWLPGPTIIVGRVFSVNVEQIELENDERFTVAGIARILDQTERCDAVGATWSMARMRSIC